MGNNVQSEKKPLYIQIANYIKQKINSGDWLEGEQLPSEEELCKKFNVSRITTKRALQELSREGLIYRKKGVGTFVSTTTTNSKNHSNMSNKIISMVIPYAGTQISLIHYMQGATDFLSSKGYYLTIYATKDDTEHEREILQNIPRTDCAGILYYPLNVTLNYDLLKPLCIKKYPIVTIDRYFNSLPISCVISNNYEGTYEIVSQLIQDGHTKIGFVSTIPLDYTSSLKERYSAYCQCLHDNGLDINYNYLLIGYWKSMIEHKTFEKQDEYLINRLKSLINNNVTALVTENDDLAYNLYRLFTKMGIKVPENITLAGFDNIKTPGINIPLLTAEQNFYGIGNQAAKLLYNMIEHKDFDYKKITIPIKIIKN